MTDIPWIEKYRPSSLEEIYGNETIIGRLKVISSNGNVPNLIISGNSGTGKTTCIHIISKKLTGDQFKQSVLELNASDSRDIDTIRSQITSFAKKKVSMGECRHKIVILDEADTLDVSSQQALRRVIDSNSSSTRFILACNTSTRIIEPIQSRCAILRLSKIRNVDIRSRLENICMHEKVIYDKGGLNAIVFTADGDMRNAINKLQTIYTGFKCVTKETVYNLCDKPSYDIVHDILKYCIGRDFRSSIRLTGKLYGDGYSIFDILQTIGKVARILEMESDKKMKFIKEISQTHTRVSHGVSTLLQLEGLCSRLSRIE